MTPAEEYKFEKKAEQHFRGKQELPLGRDFRCFRYRYDCPATDQDFKSNFDKTFPEAPGGPRWLDKKFGGL